MHAIPKILSLTILVLFSTMIHAQQKVTYQVAYSDSQIINVEGGWRLENEPKTVLETDSKTSLTDFQNCAFPGATLAVVHAGKTNYYSSNSEKTIWLGFSELSQNYVFSSPALISLYDSEVFDSLPGNFGNFGYYKRSKPITTGTFQIGSINYPNVQNVKTVEIITEHSPSSVKKIRRCNSFYTNNSKLPLLEYVYDTLWTDNSKRTIEFVLYNSGMISKIDEYKEDSFYIFPNPFDIAFTMSNSSGKEGTVVIMSISGEVLFSKDINSPSTTIEVSWLASGLYLLEFRTNDTTQTIKLIKR